MILMPLIAFAIMHSASFTLKLFNDAKIKQISIIQNAATYVRSKNAFLLQVNFQIKSFRRLSLHWKITEKIHYRYFHRFIVKNYFHSGKI